MTPRKVFRLLSLRRKHREQVDFRLIEFGTRWRHVGVDPEWSWVDVLAIFDQATLPYDHALLKVVDPEWWQFGDPNYSLLADIRDFSGVTAVKTTTPPRMTKKHFPPPVPRPGDEGKTRKVHKAPAVSFEQLDAEINW